MTDSRRIPHPLFVEPWVAVERSVLVELLREAAALVSVKTDDDALVRRLRDMARAVERGERDGLSLVEWLGERGEATGNG